MPRALPDRRILSAFIALALSGNAWTAAAMHGGVFEPLVQRMRPKRGAHALPGCVLP